MASIISGHNAQILTPPPDPNARTCNCSGGTGSCPLDGKCLTEAVVYKAAVSSPNMPERVYYGQTGMTFKRRHYGHTHDINHPPSEDTGTALSKHVWGLKEAGRDYSIKWSIERKCAPYRSGSRRCDICISEKTVIAMADPATMLNSRSEIVSGCRHRAKYKYAAVKDSAPD